MGRRSGGAPIVRGSAYSQVSVSEYFDNRVGWSESNALIALPALPFRLLGHISPISREVAPDLLHLLGRCSLGPVFGVIRALSVVFSFGHAALIPGSSKTVWGELRLIFSGDRDDRSRSSPSPATQHAPAVYAPAGAFEGANRPPRHHGPQTLLARLKTT